MPSTSENELPHILTHFERVCVLQLNLCKELESIADSLGGQVDRHQCALMASELERVMDNAHGFEKNTLFPALKHVMGMQDVAQSDLSEKFGFLTQLESEHEDDVGLAGEVVEALNQLADDSAKISPDAIGYLLRGFFVGLRRHLALEGQVLRNATTKL